MISLSFVIILVGSAVVAKAYNYYDYGDWMYQNDFKDSYAKEIVGYDDYEVAEESPSEKNGAPWPKGIIYYKMSNSFTPTETVLIQHLMRRIQSKTCLKFKDLKDKTAKHFLNITRDTNKSCSLLKKHNILSINPDPKKRVSPSGVPCTKDIRALLSLLLKTAGFENMIKHPQRDRYVTIVWKNLLKKVHVQFKKLSPKQFKMFGTKYDYDSVTHWDWKAFSKNGLPTIMVHEPGHKPNLGILSKGDITRLNRMYKCESRRK